LHGQPTPHSRSSSFSSCFVLDKIFANTQTVGVVVAKQKQDILKRSKIETACQTQIEHMTTVDKTKGGAVTKIGVFFFFGRKELTETIGFVTITNHVPRKRTKEPKKHLWCYDMF